MSHIVSCHTRPQSCAVNKKNAQNSKHAELQFSVLHVKVFLLVNWMPGQV